MKGSVAGIIKAIIRLVMSVEVATKDISRRISEISTGAAIPVGVMPVIKAIKAYYSDMGLKIR